MSKHYKRVRVDISSMRHGGVYHQIHVTGQTAAGGLEHLGGVDMPMSGTKANSLKMAHRIARDVLAGKDDGVGTSRVDIYFQGKLEDTVERPRR